MSFRAVRFATFGLMMIAAFVLGVLTTRTETSSHVTAAEVNDTRIKALRKERLAALQNVAEIMVHFHQNGRVHFSEVVEAKRAARKAELELCETDVERVAVLEKMLTEADEFEKYNRAQKEAAKGTEVAVLKAKSERLEIEIALERAKAR